MNDDTTLPFGIAIIGMSGRFPESAGIEQLWQNLIAGRECITNFSAAELVAAGVPEAVVSDPRYVRAGGVLPDIERFDAPFFAISPADALQLDPQQRLLLEETWRALEAAGYAPGTFAGPVGVFASVSAGGYLLHHLLGQCDAADVGSYGLNAATLRLMLHNDRDYVATRLSYKLDLRGPSVTVQTACSSSLTAVHLACQSLLAGECDLAIAGAAAIKIPHRVGYFYEEGSIVSPDGHCRPFSAQANGTVFSSGVGVVVLRRLADAQRDGDWVRAVIRGSAANNDGAAKASFTAPSIDSQARVIAEALTLASVPAETVSYVECHGTGTALGDPIEIAALTAAFRTETTKRAFCALGSLKGNLGHLDATSGIAGLIKTVLALEHKQLPPTLKAEEPNPRLELATSPFFLNTKLQPWQKGVTPRRAGVTSLGAGGTNVHVILEEAPEVEASPSAAPQLVTLSARTAADLQRSREQLGRHLDAQPQLALSAVAYTLQHGRRLFAHRLCLFASDTKAAARALLDPADLTVRVGVASEPPPEVAFVFSGQGAQHAGMGRALFHERGCFRDTLLRCAELLRPELGCDLAEVLYGQHSAPMLLDETWLTQPALFAIEYALAQEWLSLGVKPAVLLGHSIGEYVAACLAGVFSLEDGLRLVAVRGRLLQALPRGAMLSVRLPAETLVPLLGSLDLAAVNEPASCVVSGPEAACAELERVLTERGITVESGGVRRLRTSHAFHSAMMDAAVAPMHAALAQTHLLPPQLPLLSGVTGTWLRPEEAVSAHYWAQQLRRPVRFAECVGTLLGTPRPQLVLEVGPGRTLVTAVLRHPQRQPEHVLLSSLPAASASTDAAQHFQSTRCSLWLAGVALRLDRPAQGRRVPLPTYPFAGDRFFMTQSPLSRAGLQAPGVSALADQAAPILTGSPPPGVARPLPGMRKPRPSLSTPLVAPRSATEKRLVEIWQEVLQIETIGVNDNFFDLGGDSVIGVQIASKAELAGLRLSPKLLFEQPTPAELARQAMVLPALTAEQGILTGAGPLTPIQRWLVENYANPAGNAIPIHLDWRDKPDIAALATALSHLREHHDALRLSLRPSAGGGVQQYMPAGEPVDFAVIDLGRVPRAVQDQRILETQTQLLSNIDMAHGQLLRAALFLRGPAVPARLLLVVHHFGWDIASETILLTDLQALYDMLQRTQEPKLPPKTSAFLRWSEAVSALAESPAVLAELPYWRAQAEVPIPPLPREIVPPDSSPASTKCLSVALDVKETAALLKDVQRALRTRVDAVLLAAAGHAVALWTGHRDVLFSMDGQGREVVLPGLDIGRTVGWFTTLYPLVLRLPPEGDVLQALVAVREQLRQVPQEGLGHGVLRYVRASEDVALLRAQPQPEILFYYLGHKSVFDYALFSKAEDVNMLSYLSSTRSARYPLQIAGIIIEGSLRTFFTYDPASLGEKTVAALADRYTAALREIIAASSRRPVAWLTPTDFPGADLSRAELVDIMAEFSLDETSETKE